MHQTEIDPIYSAISAKLAAISTFVEANAQLTASATGGNENLLPATTAFQDVLVADQVVIATAPTTHRGLRALEYHLRNVRPQLAINNIARPIVKDGVVLGALYGGPEVIDWFISKRAAELMAAQQMQSVGKA
jgi:hypothetical protein